MHKETLKMPIDYQIGNTVIYGGVAYILEFENGVWWMTDQYGGEREFEPGMEDGYFPT
jgi:hypothetical protein